MNARHLAITLLSGIASLVVPSIGEPAELLVHFDMEQIESPLLDSVSGLAAEEEDGSGHLYLQPGPPGFGNAVALTEDGAWNLDEDDSTALRNLENDFTVAAWVYVESDTSLDKVETDVFGSHRIMGDNNAWDGDGWGWGVHIDGRLLFTKNGIIDASTLDSYVIEDEWTHVAVTVSIDRGLTFFVNGEEVETIEDFSDIVPTPGINGVDDWWGIGRTNQSSGDQWFAGRLDEVRVYSDLLTNDEIAALLLASSLAGDFDGNGQLTTDDVNSLNQQIARGTHDPAFDLNTDSVVDSSDLTVWVKDLKNTWIGDANLDGQFNSGDLVAVFQVGKFEQDVDAGWEEGDWTGDLRFGSGDFVVAFQDGGFEQGPRAAVSGVPEPGSPMLLGAGLIGLAGRRRGRALIHASDGALSSSTPPPRRKYGLARWNGIQRYRRRPV